MRAVIKNPRRKKPRSAAQKKATARLVALNKARSKMRRVKRVKRKNPALPKSYRAKVRHRPVTYGSAKAAGERSPYKKLNPRGGAMKRRKRRSVKRRARKSVSRNYRRRRIRRNPSAGIIDVDLKNMLMNGTLAFGSFIGGMFAGHGLVKMIAEGRNWNDNQKKQAKNIVRVALTAAAAFVLPRYLDEDKAEAVLTGLVVATGYGAMSSLFGTRFDSLAGLVDTPRAITLPDPQLSLSGRDVFNVSRELDLSGIIDMDHDLSDYE